MKSAFLVVILILEQIFAKDFSLEQLVQDLKPRQLMYITDNLDDPTMELMVDNVEDVSAIVLDVGMFKLEPYLKDNLIFFDIKDQEQLDQVIKMNWTRDAWIHNVWMFTNVDLRQPLFWNHFSSKTLSINSQIYFVPEAQDQIIQLTGNARQNPGIQVSNRDHVSDLKIIVIVCQGVWNSWIILQSRHCRPRNQDQVGFPGTTNQTEF